MRMWILCVVIAGVVISVGILCHYLLGDNYMNEPLPNSELNRDGLIKPLYRNGRFQNPFTNWTKPPLYQTPIWMVCYTFNLLGIFLVPSKSILDEKLPVIKQNMTEWGTFIKGKIRFMWLGHATTLVQFDQITILTDPMFSERSSITQLLGPKRFRDMPCDIDQLPMLNAVLISHNHFDHLDEDSVIDINQNQLDRFGKQPRWLVPMNLKEWMEDHGCTDVKELNWWDRADMDGHPSVSAILTPSQHWSGRSTFDYNKVLWGSWCVISENGGRFFFGGDTAYCPQYFQQIGDQLGPFDLAAIPIGAYEPYWTLRHQHSNPADAVRIHRDIRATHSVAVHWGTFPLAFEDALQPPDDLKKALKEDRIPESSFLALQHGEVRLFDILEKDEL